MSFETPAAEGPKKDPSFERAVMRYRAFVDALHPKIGLIYYPSCAQDTTVSAAFPGSRVVYVDIDKEAVAHLQAQGFEAHHASATDDVVTTEEVVSRYELDGKADVLILLNPAIDPTRPIEQVASGGYVLCNDYHNTATKLRERSDLTLVGILRFDRGEKKFVLDQKSPDDYWRSVESDEEFRNAPADPFGSCPYAWAQKIVAHVLGTSEGVNVYEEYKKIYEKARLDHQKMMQEILGEAAPLEDIVMIPGVSMPLNRLPRKKGGVDSLFVFRKE